MSMQLAWMTRNRPEVLARATTGFHCKDWLYFKLTGDRAHRSVGSQFHLRPICHAHLCARRARCARRLRCEAPSAGDRGRHRPVAGGLTPEAAALTGLKAGTPITLGYVDVLCTGLGGGLYDPKGETGCTIVGSTGMHMKIAPIGRSM